MVDHMDFNIGEIVRMKKPHPCGGYDWKILRCGMDFRIECVTCNRQVMLPRVKFEKGFKKRITPAPAETETE
jgi:hypothetical protein